MSAYFAAVPSEPDRLRFSARESTHRPFPDKLAGMGRYYRRVCGRVLLGTLAFLREHVVVEVMATVGLLIFALLFLSKDTQTEIAISTAFVLGPLAVLVLVVLLINLVRAPHFLATEQAQQVAALQERVTALEAAKPQLEIECKTESGLRLGDERGTLAYLEIKNMGSGQIRNAYVKLAEIIEHVDRVRADEKPYRERLYEHQDVFFKWEAGDQRMHTFATNANVRVALGRSGDGRFNLVNLGGSRLFPPLHFSNTYELLLDIAADDIAVLTARLFLRMAENYGRAEDGTPIWYVGSPPAVEFRTWAVTDQLEDELDLDEWRRINLR